MKKTLFLLILAAFALEISAQQPGYQDQYNRLYQAYIKDTHDVEAMMRLADFYSDSANTFANLPLAYLYISSAEARYMEILADESLASDGRKLLRKKITLPLVREKKHNIAQSAYDYLLLSRELPKAELDNFTEAFSDQKLILRCVEGKRTRLLLDEALQKNTIEGYETFIAQNRGTTEAFEAENAMNRLALDMFSRIDDEREVARLAAAHSGNEAVRYAADKQLAHLRYLQACEANTAQAFSDYIEQFPAGDDYLEALNRLETLSMQGYSRLSTPEELAGFVLGNSDNELAEDAMAKLRKMVTEDHNVEAARVYLEHFPLDDAYLSIYKMYYDWHTVEGNSSPIDRFLQEHPGYPFLEAAQKDLEDARTADQVYLMENFKESQIEDYASHIRMLTGKGLAFVALQRSLQEMLAAQNWKAASQRMGDYLLSFDENAYQKPFEALRALINAPARKGYGMELAAGLEYDIEGPVPHPDGKNLYFTRKMGRRTAVWMLPLSGKKRTPSEVRFAGVTSNDMAVYGFYDGGSRMLLGKDGDICVAVRTNDGWAIETVFDSPINTPYRECDASMLPDGSGMLFVSDRPGGFNLQPSGSYFHGDTAMAGDIYFVPKTADGWGTPENLGQIVNTPYCERTPVMSRDMSTLYFVSDGHGGLGYGEVLFCTRKAFDRWDEWTEPENIGKESNGPFAESSVALSSDESRLYVASNRSGRTACYTTAARHKSENRFRTVTISYPPQNNPDAQMLLVNKTSQSVLHTIRMNESGQVTLQLSRGCRFALCPQHTATFLPSVVFSPDEQASVELSEEKTIRAVIESQPLDVPLIEFESDNSLKSLGQYDYAKLLELLLAHPQMQVELIINVRGADMEEAYGQSLQRGAKLKSMLAADGVKSSRITVSAFGNVNFKSDPDAAEVQVRLEEL